MNLPVKSLGILAIALICLPLAMAKKPDFLSVGPFTTDVSQETFVSHLVDAKCRDGREKKICEGSYPNTPDVRVRGEIFDGIAETVDISFPANQRDFMVREAVTGSGEPIGGLAGAIAKKMQSVIWKGKGGKSMLMLICEGANCSLTLAGPLANKRYKACKKRGDFFC